MILDSPHTYVHHRRDRLNRPQRRAVEPAAAWAHQWSRGKQGDEAPEKYNFESPQRETRRGSRSVIRQRVLRPCPMALAVPPRVHMIERVDMYPPVPESVTNLLATLGDPQRQRVLNAFLAERSWELPVSVIVERCAPLSRPAVSHHLGVMRRTNVLVQRKDGKRTFYELNREYIQRALGSFIAFLDVCGTPIADCPLASVGAKETTP